MSDFPDAGRIAVITAKPAYNPLTVFGSALKVWFDVQDISTMWQDASATVPAAVGSRVYKQFCKVNPAFYREQSTEANRPYLRQAANGAYYLECDGSATGMVTPSIDLSAFNKIGMFTAARKLSDAASAILLELSASQSANNGTFAMVAPGGGGTDKFAFYNKGTIAVGSVTTSTAYNAPVSAVISGIADIPGDSVILRLNGAQITPGTADQGTGNYGNYPLYYFRRGGSTLPFNGWEFGNMIVASASTVPSASQIAWAERYYNSFAGAY